MRTRLLLSVGALLFACSILGISLFTATTASSSGEDSLSSKTLYFGKEILPDNVMYPVVMAVDRVQLETAPPAERVVMSLSYAERRLRYAEQLFSLKKGDLAVETVQKAEGYLQRAASETQEYAVGGDARERVVRAFVYHQEKLLAFRDHCTDAQRAVIDRLLAENTAATRQLQK